MDRLITTYAQLMLAYAPEKVRASMEKRGHGKLWKRTLRKALLLAGKSTARTEPVVTLARESDKQKHAENIAKSGGAEARVAIDASIVGGFILQKGFSRIDRSYKTALHTLYKKVTA